jgi:hypothetical protein
MSTMTIPSTVAAVYLAAAKRLLANGHYVGDFFPNALSVPDRMSPMSERPLNVAAAIQMAATGHPLRDCFLSRRALWLLADHVAEVDVKEGDDFDALTQLDAWEESVSDSDVMATLLDLAQVDQ